MAIGLVMGRVGACLVAAGGRRDRFMGDLTSCNCMRTLVGVIDIIRAKMAWVDCFWRACVTVGINFRFKVYETRGLV